MTSPQPGIGLFDRNLCRRCTLGALLLATVSLGNLSRSPVLGQEKGPQPASSQSTPEALNLFADAASFQNNGAFELAAEEWEKFLKKFPTDPLATKARHYAGVCQLQLKRYAPAASHFQAVLAKDAKFELAEDAAINLGWCQFSLGGEGNKEMYAKAIESLSAYLTRYPSGKFADQAMFYLGESQYAAGQKPEAIASYQRLVRELPKSTLRADALYALGVTLEESRKYAEAGEVFDKFGAEFPKHSLAVEIRMRKGETLFHTGQLAEAETVFAEVAAKPGFPAADHAVFRQGDCAARQDRFADAGQLYARVVTDFPASAYLADAAIAAGRSFYRAEKFDEASQWLQKSIELGGKDAPEAAHWLCRIYLKRKESQRVIDQVAGWIAAAGESPYRVHLSMDQADALYEKPDSKPQSIEHYLKIAAEHPQHEVAPQALYNAAFATLELKQFAAAAKHATDFAQRFPQDRLLPDIQYVAAESQLHQGNYSVAEGAYQALIEKYPQHADSNLWRVRRGLALYLQKNYAAAVKALEGCLDQLSVPDHLAEARFLIGVSLFEQNQPADAARMLTAAVAVQPKWRQADETLLFLSRAEKGAGRLDEATQTAQRLIAEFPTSPLLDQAYYRLGEYKDAAGDYPGAAAAYEVVLTRFQASPFAPYSEYGRGWSKMRAKDYAGASDSFSRLLADYANHPLTADAYFARGMSRRQAGQFAEAVADLAKFLDMKPGQPRRSDALYERGLAEAAQKKYAEAAGTLHTLLEENKSYPLAANVLYELAWARKNGEQPDEAAAAFARLAAEHPDSPLAPEALYHVGEHRYQQQQFAEAVKSYSAALDKAKGEVAENVTHKLGWSHFRLGQFEQALTQFRSQTQKFSSGSLAADGLFMQAECLFKMQNYKEAWPAFEASVKSPPTLVPMQVLAYLHGGQSAAQLEQWAASLQLLDVIPGKFPDSSYLAEALYERGWAKQNLKKLDDAIADYELAATQSRGDVGARARFMIGEIQFERKEHAEAIKSFLRVMYGYGGENAPDPVKKWQGSAGYEAGRCAEVQVQGAQDAQEKARLIQDAKTYYTFVVEKHAMHQLANQAKERLAALAKLK